MYDVRLLIVKTSSLGDIIQTFNVLDDLHARYPGIAIDWAVEAPFYPIVAAHPLVRKAIPLQIRKWDRLWEDFCNLRKEKYEVVFDLQGNCKSGVITLLARGKVKVGYGFRSVREWPNILATNVRFEVSKQKNIRLYYLELIEHYFGKKNQVELQGVRFKIGEEEKKRVDRILEAVPTRTKVMVCPGSKWANKQLSVDTLVSFLQKMEGASFLLVWGDLSEKSLCEEVQSRVKNCFVIDKLPIPTWQNLMSEMDLVVAVDSSALHLCGTTSTPSFSIFGPTSSDVFKPIGKRHFSIQGKCPYNRTFEKQCPVLRSCPTGACIKSLTAEELFAAYRSQCGSRPL